MMEPNTVCSPPRLRCLGDQGAPPDLVEDAMRLLGFARAAQRAFWMLLVPSVVDAPPTELSAQLDAFAQQHELQTDALASTLRAHRCLLRGAAERRLGKADYAADLVALAGSELQGRRLLEVLMPGFELGCKNLQQERVGDALAAHGSLLERTEWRLDEMVLSQRGGIDRARVGLVTMSYRTGDRRDRITLQLLPPQLELLEQACRAMLGKTSEEMR